MVQPILTQSLKGFRHQISNLEFIFFYLNILQQIKDSIPNFLTQHLEQPISVHMQKKWGELGQKWPS